MRMNDTRHCCQSEGLRQLRDVSLVLMLSCATCARKCFEKCWLCASWRRLCTTDFQKVNADFQISRLSLVAHSNDT